MKQSILVILFLASFSLQASGKYAFINSKLLLEKSPQAVAANASMQQQFGAREQSLRGLAQSIEKMEADYAKDKAIMSSEQQKKAEDNLIQNKRRFQFEQQSMQEDLQSRQRELLKEVQIALRSVIQAYGKANNYDFIFTDASIAFASDTVDITDEILLELEKK